MATEKRVLRRTEDIRMQRDGFVSLQRASEALGMTYMGVRKAVEEGRIPGKRVDGFGTYARWYVDVRALLKACPIDGSTETRAAIVQLAKSLGMIDHVA